MEKEYTPWLPVTYLIRIKVLIYLPVLSSLADYQGTYFVTKTKEKPMVVQPCGANPGPPPGWCCVSWGGERVESPDLEKHLIKAKLRDAEQLPDQVLRTRSIKWCCGEHQHGFDEHRGRQRLERGGQCETCLLAVSFQFAQLMLSDRRNTDHEVHRSPSSLDRECPENL